MLPSLMLPHIDPVAFQLGPLQIRWYGLMYLVGFVGGYFYLRHLTRLHNWPGSRQQLADMMFACVLGVVLGGRLGYVLIYHLGYYLSHPLAIGAIWEGGMSFHGGLLGVVLATIIYCRRHQLPILQTGDCLVTAAPLGLFAGRIGNFVNGELWGRPADVPWAMVFPLAGPLPRHPSQLYEAAGEGLLLGLVLYLLLRRQPQPGLVFWSFWGFYGLIRFVLEFFRAPDAHLGLLWVHLTMGQWLSVAMMVLAAAGWLWQRQGGVSSHA